jgi:predicted nuclease of restriction endonuclease-like RecB superfamily
MFLLIIATSFFVGQWMTMANFVPVMTIFATFIVIANVPSNSYASECALSNIEIINKFIDERINATVSTMVAEFTATLEESIAASVNATLNALNATVDEKIATIGTTVGAHDVSIFKLLSQSGRCVNYALISLKAYFQLFNVVRCMKYI